jgi:hypothetical protein
VVVTGGYSRTYSVTLLASMAASAWVKTSSPKCPTSALAAMPSITVSLLRLWLLNYSTSWLSAIMLARQERKGVDIRTQRTCSSLSTRSVVYILISSSLLCRPRPIIWFTMWKLPATLTTQSAPTVHCSIAAGIEAHTSKQPQDWPSLSALPS